MTPAADRLLQGGVRVIPAFEHMGPARALVHQLKYKGLSGYAQIVSAILAERAPRAPLVPIPRARTRLARYGTDPALVLAQHLSSRIGQPVYRLFSAPWHSSRRAGGDHRRPVAFPSIAKTPLERVTLVDDVCTTGATLEAAVRAIGERHISAAVVANAAPEVSSLRRRDPTVAP